MHRAHESIPCDCFMSPMGTGGIRNLHHLDKGCTYVWTHMAQGSSHLVAGATKRYGLSSREALKECGRAVRDPAEVAAAAAEMLPRAAAVWPPVARCMPVNSSACTCQHKRCGTNSQRRASTRQRRNCPSTMHTRHDKPYLPAQAYSMCKRVGDWEKMSNVT